MLKNLVKKLPNRNKSKNKRFLNNSFESSRLIVAVAFVILSSVFLASCGGPSDEDKKEAQNLIDQAQESVEDYEFADAMKSYDKARNIDSGNHEIYTGLSEVYVMKNRTEDAKEVLESGKSSARYKSEILEQLGMIYLEEGEIDDALSNLEDAVKDDGENWSAQYYLAVAHVNDGSPASAREQLDIPEDDGDLYVKSQLLKAVLQGSDTAAAEEELEGLDPEDSLLSSKVEFYQEVLQKIDGLGDDEKTDKYVDVLLASGALNAGFEDIVIESLSGYTEDDEVYWELYLNLGAAYSENGDTEKAQEYLTTSESLNPAQHYAAWYLARMQKDQNNITEMQENYERAISLATKEDKIEIRNEYAEILIDEENYLKAEEQYQKLIKEDGDHASRHSVRWAEALVNREQYSDAIEVLDGLDQADMGDEILADLNWLHAVVEFNSGDRNKAKDWIDAAIELNGNKAEYHLLLGQTLFENGEDEDAEEALERAIDLDLEGDVSGEAMKVLDRI